MSSKIPPKVRIKPKKRRAEAEAIAGEDVFEWLVLKWAYEPDEQVKWERGMQLLPWLRAKPRPSLKPEELPTEIVVRFGGDE